MEGAPKGPERARAFAGTCPDCCGDLGVTPIEGGWILTCIHCGATVHGMRRIPARRDRSLAVASQPEQAFS